MRPARRCTPDVADDPRRHLANVFGLFGGESDRARAIDMGRRLLWPQLGGLAAALLAFAAGIGAHNAWALVPLALSEIAFVAALFMPHLRRFELPLAAAWAAGQTLVVLAILIAGGERAYLWATVAMTLQFVGVIWTRRLTYAAAAATVLAIVACSLLLDFDQLRANPVVLLPAITCVIAAARAATALRDIDHRSRGTVLVDVLTGLRNRVALQQELAALSAGGAIAVIDLDHFKSINDIHGHAVGDAVLRAAAARVEQTLAPHGSVFRYGGEEFVALLPSAGLERARELTEMARRAIADTPVGGLALTTSAGVAAGGTPFAAADVFAAADGALYRAKQMGRNRVEIGTLKERTRTLPNTAAGQISATAISEPHSHARAHSRGGRRLIHSVVQHDQLLAVVEGFDARRLRIQNVGLVIVGALMAPWHGWLPAAVLAAHAVLLDPRVRLSQRMTGAGRRSDDSALLREALMSMALITTAVVAASRPALFALPLLVLPAFPVAAGYPRRVTAAMTIAAALLAVAACAIVAPQAVIDNPVIVAMPIGMLVTVAMVGATIGGSAVDHRAAAIVDPLTGALNRAALDVRLPEIAERAAARRTPVAVIVGDLDHFKAVNDLHGHAAGDRVLTVVSERIRDEVRIADALYRIGGEEFMVLLDATQTGAATQIAERIRARIAAEPIDGITVTISLGLSGSPGQLFRYSEAFARADGALLAAKQDGRNRVSVAPPTLRAVEAA